MTIYFVTYGEGEPIKIGYTASPVEKRVAGLQTGLPHKLIILAEMDGTYEDEKALHKQFADHHVHGEWFQPNEELWGIIRQHERPKPPEEPETGPEKKVISVKFCIDAEYDPEAGDVPWSKLTGKFTNGKRPDWLENSHFFDWRHIVKDGKLPTAIRHFE